MKNKIDNTLDYWQYKWRLGEIVWWRNISDIISFINENSKQKAYFKNNQIRCFNWKYVHNFSLYDINRNWKTCKKLFEFVNTIKLNKKFNSIKK